MDEQWIKEMQQKMADYQWPAPELSWDELDQALSANHPPKTRQLWFRCIAAAAVILLIAGVGYWGFLHDDTEQILPTTALVETSQGDRHTVRSENHLTGCLSPCEVGQNNTKQKYNLSAMSEPDIEVPVSAEYPDTLNITTSEDEVLPRSNEENDIRPKKQDPQAPTIYPSELHRRQHLENRLTAKVYMSSTMVGNQTKSSQLIGSYSTVDTYSPELTKHKQYVHHRQPVRFGLSLRYRLTDRWSVESGLSYTRLTSDITTIVDEETTVTEQRLNYIGLPLNISYELWKSRKFGLYVTGGGMIEKCLDANPWQFSINGAVGAEYKLTEFFSLYAEPGIGYYFKDGSSKPTIYKDRPLNFNLIVGIRFNLK